MVTNIDRTAKNPNLLISQRQLWLIDHGAALYFHHHWPNDAERSRQPFAAITDHVLIRFATVVAEIDASLAAHLDAQSLQALVTMLPDAWLTDEPPFATPDAVRAAYLDYLLARSAAPRDFATEAIRAHARTV